MFDVSHRFLVRPLMAILFCSLLLLSACSEQTEPEATADEPSAVSSVPQEQPEPEEEAAAPESQEAAVERPQESEAAQETALAAEEEALPATEEEATVVSEDLQELLHQLDFTTARLRAAQLAEESEDEEEQQHYRNLAQTFSAYARRATGVRRYFTLLAGNQIERQQGMTQILQGDELILLFMDAVVDPSRAVTDDDQAISPTVLELALALGHQGILSPALQRHAGLAPGELRQAVSDAIVAQIQAEPESFVQEIEAHMLEQNPFDVIDLMPAVTELIVEQDLFSEAFRQQYPKILQDAAGALGEEHELLRVQLFEAAIRLGDSALSQQIMQTLGSEGADLEGLPPGWSGNDLGEVPEPGSAVFRDGRFVLRSGGEDYWGDRDNGYWAWRRVEGNASLRARIHAIDGRHNYSKAGIAFRAANTGESRHASIVVSPGRRRDEGYRFVLGSRSEDAGDSNNSGNSKLPLPYWMELQRQGEEVIARVSADGENWEEFERMTLDLEDSFYMGLVLSARYDDDMAEAEIEVPLEYLFSAGQ